MRPDAQMVYVYSTATLDVLTVHSILLCTTASKGGWTHVISRVTFLPVPHITIETAQLSKIMCSGFTEL